MDIYLGFDPGGQNKFGWAVCSSHDGVLKVICTGIADHAKGAEKSHTAFVETIKDRVSRSLVPCNESRHARRRDFY